MSMRLEDLPPRVRKMLLLILQNRRAIIAPGKGHLELHFDGGSVTARLYSRQGLRLDGEHDDRSLEAATAKD